MKEMNPTSIDSDSESLSGGSDSYSGSLYRGVEVLQPAIQKVSGAHKNCTRLGGVIGCHAQQGPVRW